MLKVLWITECYPSKELPQYCIFLEQQIKSLIKLGHVVDVLIPIKNSSKNKVSYEIYNEVNVYKIGYSTDKYNLFLSKGSKELRKEMELLIEKEKYDILAGHIVSETVYYAIWKIAKKIKLKSILTFHGLNVFQDYYKKNGLLDKFYFYRKKFLFSKANAIIGVSNKVKTVIEKEINNVPVFCVYNGVDTKLFAPKIKSISQNEEIIIVAIGNLIPIKGFNYLIDAIYKIVNDDMKVKVYILGRGKEENQLKEQSKKLNLNNIIEFVGYKPYNLVKEYLQNADIFILPSYFEAIGCVYLEAMACGVATIGVKNQGIDEVITDGYNGLLVEPKNVNSIYEKLKLLICNNDLRIDIANNGRKTAEQFTWEKSAKNIEKIYNTVLQRDYC